MPNGIDPTLAALITTPSFAVLFVWLLYSTRKEAAAREKEYQSVIRRQVRIMDRMSELLRKCGLEPPHESDKDGGDSEDV